MLEVLAPGLLTTVQDLGRPGMRHLGIAPGGAADRDALRIANLLVGNSEDAAGLEFTLAGPSLRIERDTLIAITGGECDAECAGVKIPGWRSVLIRAGQILKIGRLRRGARGYLAFDGGVATAPVLGSRSTDLRACFGGFEGRPLKLGDRLPLMRANDTAAGALRRRLQATNATVVTANWWMSPTEDLRGDLLLLHLLPGRDIAALDPRALRVLRDGTWSVAAESDRMGLRFEGPTLPRDRSHEQISAAVLPGIVQLPPDGRPILLGVDAQTVGGYPRVAHVIRADLGLAMQLRPGDHVRPVLVSVEAADAAWLARQRAMARMAEAIAGRLAAA